MLEPHLSGTTVPLTVAASTPRASDVVELTLCHSYGAELPGWEPGAHIDVALGPGLVRQYSLCGGITDREQWRIGVLLEQNSRGGSRRIHELRPGDQVSAAGPRNHFHLVPSPAYLFIAGGIGITPLIPMIDKAELEGADWHLLYGGRGRASMAYADALQHSHGDRVTIVPQDEAGLIDLPGHLSTPRPGVLVYACGPTPLLDAVGSYAEAWPHGAIHMERFAPKALEEPVRHDSFNVILERSGLTLEVTRDRSILETVQDAGIDVPWSCSEGTCGSCEVRVTGGKPDHRDSVLSADEREANESMMICVSRSLTPDLRLDA